MLKKRYMLIITLVPVLFGNLIYSIPAQTQPDPWCDFDENMDIDIDDVRHFCESYIAYWTIGSLPINKTGLLLELQDRVDNLNASLLDLEAYLETRITTLEASLVYLEARVSESEAKSLGFINSPAYDSGWVNISVGEEIVFTHNLSTTEVFVYIIGKSELLKIHQRNYGVYDGVHWYRLTNTTITVRRDTGADYWDYVRVMIWIIQEPPT